MLSCVFVLIVSERYESKSAKGKRDERYKERLKKENFAKYKQRVARSSIRSKVSQWRKQLEKDYRNKEELERKLQTVAVNNLLCYLPTLDGYTMCYCFEIVLI